MERLMTDDTTLIDSQTATRLTEFITKIERLEEEKKGIADDIKDVMSMAKGAGFEPAIIRIILKQRKRDADDLEEEQSLLEVYKRAIGMQV
jgi:uncharacterized protein (UPF0335 family)